MNQGGRPSSRLRLPLVRLLRDEESFDLYDEHDSLASSREELFAALRAKRAAQLELVKQSSVAAAAAATQQRGAAERRPAIPMFRRLEDDGDAGDCARWLQPRARIARRGGEEGVGTEDEEGVGSGFSEQHLRHIYAGDDESDVPAGAASVRTPDAPTAPQRRCQTVAAAGKPPLAQPRWPRAQRGTGEQLDFLMLF
jgi:hypothetical protein